VKQHLTRLSAMAAAVCTAALLAACGGDEESTGASSTAKPSEGPKLKVAMVTDIGGLNDRSFNALAYKGLQDAEKDLGVDIRAVTSKSNADYVPNLSTLARQKYDVVFAVGFLMADATAKVAKSFPQTKFAIIDFPQSELAGKPMNVEGLLFKENESGYLAGYMAGLYVKNKGGEQVISTVGGQKIPPVDGYIAGYQAGAKAANPEIETLNAYSQDFIDQAKCKELALNQIEEGSQVVFQVAGQCGLGALDAAKEKGVQGIGVDADQAFLGDHILTSALKKIDQAVLKTITEVQGDTYKGGESTLFDAKSDGIGLGKVNAEGQKLMPEVEKIEQQIAAGEIADIPAEVK